jgi:hypothetical protein
MWFNRDGQPITATEAEPLLGNKEYARVALTRVTSVTDPAVDFIVSTVWLGINYNFNDGPPILFETMVFGGNEDQQESCYRWTTRQVARDGHAEIVATVAASIPDDRVVDLDDWPVSLVKRNP